MLKLFRKIRKKLIEQSKVRNYFLYALGEIVLVVIGILIALQLNIQKEEAKEKQATEQLLIGIQADLKLEVARIEFLQAYYGGITEGIQQILLNYQQKESNTNQELGQFFLNTFEFRKFSKFNTNYQTLYGSGLLQEIEDRTLSEDIITYYSIQFLEWSLEIYQQKAGAFNFNNATQFDPLDKLLRSSNYQHIPNFKLNVNDAYATNFKELIKAPEVLNFLTDLLHQSELVFSNLKNYKETNLALSNRIQKYLKP
ncbi:MAG: hypothetical protein GW839_09355 [Flavobacteriales bacterium]|nr:hypothetical protein [Flavobacteriia bacterium]NCP06710.1 hypothetical protein [Flavobacteriales bacterium]PIY11247.1 MAG: hypothetical protein COZ17_07375 [Flavobacteriaceae bacterium CG_4_10_14_3_um_filter_33_47]NCP53030.1 hypothetical protein [Flavobacteriales bacterium]NCP60490.1 hypothetical protein [Flavobacteriales bacterium]